MALIFCEECGNQYSENAFACPKCGNPNRRMSKNDTNARWVIGRITVSIITLVLSVYILFQSCCANLISFSEDNGDIGGTSGFFTVFLMIIGAILGICTRKSSSKSAPIFAGIFYLLAAIIGITMYGVFEDLQIWGWLSAIFGVIYIIAGILTKKS